MPNMHLTRVYAKLDCQFLYDSQAVRLAEEGRVHTKHKGDSQKRVASVQNTKGISTLPARRYPNFFKCGLRSGTRGFLHNNRGL
jgi:hypothetical protein